MLHDDELAARIESDHTTAGLSARRRAMLDFAVKLTETPAAMTAGDVEALRSVGFDDADILAIVEVTAYYAYVNRIADGLGVEPEPWIDHGEP